MGATVTVIETDDTDPGNDDVTPAVEEAIEEAVEEEVSQNNTADAVDAVEVASLINHEGRITILEERMSDVQNTADNAATTAAVALNQAEQAQEEVAAVEEETPPLIEEMIETAEYTDTDKDGDIDKVDATPPPTFRDKWKDAWS